MNEFPSQQPKKFYTQTAQEFFNTGISILNSCCDDSQCKYLKGNLNIAISNFDQAMDKCQNIEDFDKLGIIPDKKIPEGFKPGCIDLKQIIEEMKKIKKQMKIGR